MVGEKNTCSLYLGENICCKHYKWFLTPCILRRFPAGDHTQNEKLNYMLLYSLIKICNPYITLSKPIGRLENCMAVQLSKSLLFLLPDKLFPWQQPFILYDTMCLWTEYLVNIKNIYLRNDVFSFSGPAFIKRLRITPIGIVLTEDWHSGYSEKDLRIIQEATLTFS